MKRHGGRRGARPRAVNQAEQTIDNRINAFGVAEPVIQPPASGNRIVVAAPRRRRRRSACAA